MRYVQGISGKFPDAELFAFSHMKEPEGVILLKRSPGVLLTCDAIQSYATPPYTPQTSAIAQLLMPLRGFPRKTLIGAIWMKILVEDRDGMKSEFERLLRLDFDQLLSAHGTFVPKNAHAQVEQAFQEMFN